jgi:hypothetical protein
MAHTQHTPTLASLEEAITLLFYVVDDALLNPRAKRYESLKRLCDSEVLTLALFQQPRGVESERSFLLRDLQRFFVHLFPGVAGIHPSSLHRLLRRLRGYLEPLRRTVLTDLRRDPETLVVDSTLLEVLHPREVAQSEGFEGAAWVRWDSFSIYGVKLHMMCATNRIPVSYELALAGVTDVLLVEELLEEANSEAKRRGGSSGTLLPLRAAQEGPRPPRRRRAGDR